MKYKVVLPEGVEHVVFNDVFIREPNPGGAVVMYNPVVAGNGYLDTTKFWKPDWEKSLLEGQAALLIKKGVLVVEDDTVSSVSPITEKETVSVEKAYVGEVSKFSQLSFKEKLSYIKSCSDVNELNKIITGEVLNSYFTRIINKKIKGLTK